MCYHEYHTCVCDHGDHPKLLLKRTILCPASEECSLRDDPPQRTVIRCEDFHKGPRPILRYKCAVCRRDDDVLISQGTSFISYTWIQSKDRKALGFTDLDFLTEFQHLAKKRESGRHYFVQRDYRNGYINTDDEYATEIYTTGNVFIRESDGTLVRIDDDERSRNVKHFEDPSPKRFRPNGQRDFVAEALQACANESSLDRRYNKNSDTEGGRTLLEGERGNLVEIG